MAARLLLALLAAAATDGAIEIRASQVGYRPGDIKSALAFGLAPLPERFTVRDAANDAVVFEAAGRPSPGAWAAFTHHAELEFTALARPGRYVLALGDARSRPFVVDDVA